MPRLQIIDAGVLYRNPLPGHQAVMAYAPFVLPLSPDGKLLASGSLDRTVRLWNPASGESRKLEGHEGQVTSVSFSPDGKMLASGDLIAGVNKGVGKTIAGTFQWERVLQTSPWEWSPSDGESSYIGRA